MLTRTVKGRQKSRIEAEIEQENQPPSGIDQYDIVLAMDTSEQSYTIKAMAKSGGKKTKNYRDKKKKLENVVSYTLY